MHATKGPHISRFTVHGRRKNPTRTPSRYCRSKLLEIPRFLARVEPVIFLFGSRYMLGRSTSPGFSRERQTSPSNPFRVSLNESMPSAQNAMLSKSLLRSIDRGSPRSIPNPNLLRFSTTASSISTLKRSHTQTHTRLSQTGPSSGANPARTFITIPAVKCVRSFPAADPVACHLGNETRTQSGNRINPLPERRQCRPLDLHQSHNLFQHKEPLFWNHIIQSSRIMVRPMAQILLAIWRQHTNHPQVGRLSQPPKKRSRRMADSLLR